MRRHTWLLLPIISLALACRDAVPSAPTASLIGLPISGPPIRLPLRIDLGTLGGASSFAWDINNSGTVVGAADNADGMRRAFRWTALTGMRDLGTLPGDDWSAACCITNDGQILGVSGLTSVSTSFGTHVIWSSSGTITARSIPLLPGHTASQVSDFNTRGDVVGTDFGSGHQRAWFWSEVQGKYDITGNTPNLQGIEGAATAVDGDGLVLALGRVSFACFRTNPCWRPILWSHETGYRVLGTPGDSMSVTMPRGLSDGPTVVGLFRTRGMSEYPFRWIEGEGFTILPTDAGGGQAMAVNDRGTAVGVEREPPGAPYSFTAYAMAWPRSGGAIRLSPDIPRGENATAINNVEVVVGWSPHSGGGAHATAWFLGPVSGVVARLAAMTPVAVAGTATRTAAAAAAAANACLWDPDAELSRGALFACVNRSAAAR